MITAQKKRQIQQSLQSLATTNAIAVDQIEKTISLLSIALELDDCVSPVRKAAGDAIRNPKSADAPSVDDSKFSIEWGDRICFLGNTLLFRFFARIALSPNRYVAHVDLLEDVWGGERENTTIRGVAKRLRDRLSECGMEKLADSIDGSVFGYYGLILV